MRLSQQSFVSAALLCTALVSLGAQTPDPQPAPPPASPPLKYTDSNYAQAEKFMPYNVDSLVLHHVDKPVWLADGRMVYRDTGARGETFVVVDPVRKTKAPAFDQARLAAALTPFSRSGQPVDANHLPFTGFDFIGNGQTIRFTAFDKRFTCDLSAAAELCKQLPDLPAPAFDAKGQALPGTSPDGTKLVFLRDWNLWLRSLETGAETQLTFDGQPNFGYATDNAGWKHTTNPIVAWSPDSRRIATFQQDQRQTGEMYTVGVSTGHPTLTTLKYPLPGDEHVTMIERVVIDLPSRPREKARIVRLKMPPDQHRSSLCDDIACQGTTWTDVEWAADSRSLGFVSTSRDHTHEWFRIANPDNGDVREIFNETAAKFFESGYGKRNWHYLSATNELLWFSERSGWGHLYLYDIATGKLKNQITSGDWNVMQVLGIDERARTLYFLGLGRENGENPYYPMYYSIGFDGQNLNLLTPERASHVITPSSDNGFFVDTFSTPTQPEVTVLRNAQGEVAVDVAREDISRLKATGWIPPVEMEVKARDGRTDLYGFLFRPTNFSTDKLYPIIDHVYPGPQSSSWSGTSCGARNFLPAHGDLQALAELGFIVICIDGEGTGFRSKAFHEAYFGNLGDDTIPDQVTGIQQLAQRYPWVDATRVGIFGHSGGGNATASAMFHFPDFFKVGIAESGNHDNRIYEDDWAEKWSGLLTRNADGTSNYDSQANQAFAKNLKGHLLLAHGTSDDNVPLNETLLVVDALIKADKDFDLILFPNEHHGYAEAANYMTRRRWDYFVRYLAGDIPPNDYVMKPMKAAVAALYGNGPADVDWTTREASPQP